MPIHCYSWRNVIKNSVSYVIQKWQRKLSRIEMKMNWNNKLLLKVTKLICAMPIHDYKWKRFEKPVSFCNSIL